MMRRRHIAGMLAWLAGIWVAAVAAAQSHNRFSYLMTKTIQFECTEVATNMGLERVNIDLSLNSGETWPIRIAHGLPTRWGTNEYQWTYRVTPAVWTENARVAVRTLFASATNRILSLQGGISDGDFAICGVRILAPVTDQQVPLNAGMALSWHEAGADVVEIAVSPDQENWTHIASRPSPAATNNWYLPIIGYTPGPLWIRVSAFDDLYDIVRVQIVPAQ